MAQNLVTQNNRGGRRGRNRGERRDMAQQLITQAAASVPQEYFAPERQWIAQRGPQIARVAQQVKMLTALVNAEKQFYDVSGNVNPIVTPVAQYLNGIAEGDDSQGRQGRSIRAKELEVRMNFNSAAAATGSVTCRAFIVKDNLPQGSVPGVATLFQGATQGVNNMAVLDTNQGRFKWLYDETFVLGAVAGGQDSKVITVSLKLDHHINFIGATGATASAGGGTLWLFVLCDTVAAGAPTGAFYSRLRYYDN
jgi:hypothetical protein